MFPALGPCGQNDSTASISVWNVSGSIPGRRVTDGAVPQGRQFATRRFRRGGWAMRWPASPVSHRLGSPVERSAKSWPSREQADAAERLRRGSSGPVEHIERVVSWLEGEQRSGILEQSYTTASLVTVVDDSAVWTWHVGPHGAACGRRAGVRFRSTDSRYPVLRQLGVMKQSAVQIPGTVPSDNASSIYCIGTPSLLPLRWDRAPRR